MSQAPPRRIAASPLAGFVYVNAPVGGIDTDSAPMFMPQQFAPIVDNWIAAENKLVMRRPFLTTSHMTNVAKPNRILGWLFFTGSGGGFELVVTPRKAQTFSIDPIHAPWVQTKVQTALTIQASLTNYIWAGPPSGDPATVAYAAVYGPPGQCRFRIDDFVYYISAPTNVYNTPASGNYWIAKSNMSYTPPGGGALSLTFAPLSATWADTYQSRIWALGGIDQNTPGATYDPNVLFYTNPILAGGGAAAADWIDPTTLKANVLTLDRDSTDPGSGIAVANNALIVFKKHSTYVLRGSTPSTYTLSLLSREAGCVDPRSIVETDHGVYFMSHKGWSLTTGTSVVDVSGHCSRDIYSAVQRCIFNIKTELQSGGVHAALLSDGKILVSITISLGSSFYFEDTIWSGVYDPSTGSWVRFTSSLFGNHDTYGSNATTTQQDLQLPGMLVHNNKLGIVYSVANNNLTVIEHLAGSIGPISPSLNMFQVGDGGFNDLDVVPSPFTHYPIPAKVRTRTIPITSEGRFTVNTILMTADYVMQATSGPAVNMALTLINEQGSAVNSSLSLPLLITSWIDPDMIPPLLSPFVQHAMQDLPSEEAWLAFELKYTDSTASFWNGSRAEFYGMGLEFQQSKNLR